MRTKLLAATFATACLFSLPSVAQTQVTQQQVVAACATAAATQVDCQAAIAAYFAALQAAGVVGVALEQAIADLVVELAETPALTPELRVIVADALQTIGTTYATGEQATAILEVAATVASGEAIAPDSVVIPVSSSPA